MATIGPTSRPQAPNTAVTIERMKLRVDSNSSRVEGRSASLVGLTAAGDGAPGRASSVTV